MFGIEVEMITGWTTNAKVHIRWVPHQTYEQLHGVQT